ncbi:hypothetical protein SAMN04488056_105246 [Cohaesibacter marisflavi]|uniref:Uncharacterized protein n=1 Tax=Cohaesibacter marisflavi TaxID=655353 RepID=A0A1I5GXM5_9HYPH|nr:hypothetical protein [Cohaesibacter marisflavi]SFO40745.1 hypothetical protein SAMN04488056_105246 [Cohaesibacter marisflavi]
MQKKSTIDAASNGNNQTLSTWKDILEASGIINFDPKTDPWEILQMKIAKAGEVSGAPTSQLRDPYFESELACFFRAWELSAMRTLHSAISIILDHHANGGVIATAKGEVLDIERMETFDKPCVYNIHGNVVLFGEDCPLSNLENSFTKCARRAMNRFFEKASQPSIHCIENRRLSMIFWLDIARKIVLERCKTAFDEIVLP